QVHSAEQTCAHAGGLDDAGAARDQLVQQERGEQERGKVVDLEGLLEPIDGLGAVAEDTTRIVGENVDTRIRRIEFCRERAHVPQAGEVRDEVVCAELTGNRLGLLRRPADDDDSATVAVKLTGRSSPDAIACSGDHDRLRLELSRRVHQSTEMIGARAAAMSSDPTTTATAAIAVVTTAEVLHRTGGSARTMIR